MRRWPHGITVGVVVALTCAATAVAASASRHATPITFGLAAPLSGPLTYNGTQEADGAKLAVKQLNAKGGVLGHPINFVTEDDACDPTDAVTAANKLIDQHPSVMFGFHCSSATLAGMPIVERAQIPLINSISTNPNITAESGVGGNKWVFTLTPTDATFAHALAGFLKRAHVTRLAIAAENTDYGRGGAEALKTSAAAVGITVTSTNYYTQGTSDFTSLLASIKSQNVQRVAFWGLGADDANFSRQFAQTFQGTGTLLSGRPELVGPDTPNVQTGALAGATSVAQYSNSINTPANRTFVAQFQQEYGTVPVIQSFEGYQEVMLAARAVQQAKSVAPAAIRNALTTIKFPSMLAQPNSKGAVLSFDKHQQAHDRAAVLIVRGTKVVLLAVIPT